MKIMSILPVESSNATVYNQVGKIGLAENEDFELTFTPTEIVVYISGVLAHTITSTNFGNFRDIKDVTLMDNFILVIDGNHILKIDLNTSPATFITFFGGYGGSDSEYKFQNPSRVIYDETVSKIYVWDKGNKNLKVYNKEFSHLETITLGDVLDVNAFNDVVYTLNSSTVKNINTNFEFNHGVENVQGIVIDSTQEGFLWVNNSSSVFKFTVNGLNVGTHTGLDNVLDVFRRGTRLHILNDTTWKVTLDFAFTQTVKGGFEFPNPVSSIYVDPDEFVNDWVINDTNFKLFENIDEFNLALTGEFVVDLNAESEIFGISVEPVTAVGCDIDCNFFISQDEVVACNILNRTIDNIYDLMVKTGNKLQGIDNIVANDNLLSSFAPSETVPISWSIGAQSCEGVEPQLFNPNFTPITFAEFDSPLLSCNPMNTGCVSGI